MFLVDLGPDVILAIAQYLSEADIFNLWLTSKSLREILTSNSGYRLLYTKKFGSKPTPLNLKSYNWESLFKLRISYENKVYSWGSSSLGRLGYSIKDVPSNHHSDGFTRNVHTPSNISNFNGHIVTDISAGGFCIQILTNDGSLYYTGSSWKKSEGSCSTPGPILGSDYGNLSIQLASSQNFPFLERVAPRRMPPRRQGVPPMPYLSQRYDRDISVIDNPTNNNNRQTNPNLRKSPEELNLYDRDETSKPKNEVKESSFITKLSLPEEAGKVKLKTISSGREHFIALDNSNNIYSWDTGNTSRTGVKIKFEGIDDKSLVTKISAGWNLSACHINNIGIVVWFTREPITEAEFKSRRMESRAKYVIIPNSTSISDFVAGYNYILYIGNDSKLYKVEIDAYQYASSNVESTLLSDPESVEGFNEWLENHRLHSNSNSAFTKLTGCYTNFTVFTNDGNVLIGRNDENSGLDQVPLLIPELQNKNIIHLVNGDYHSMALTDEGDLYSWGIESNQCGCLGLGSKDSFINDHKEICQDLGINKGMNVKGPSLVRKPTKEGKWLAIAAAGWHSCGLFISDTSKNQ